MFDIARCSINDDDFEALAIDDLVPAISVDVVDLDTHIVREMVLPRVRFANLPEDVSVEVHGSQTRALAVRVLGAVMEDLGHKDVGFTVPRQVAESKVTTYSETLGRDLLPKNGFGVLLA